MPKHRSHGSGSGSNSNSVESAPAPRSSAPVVANFASHHLTIGCGVAIFHVASEKVVLCFHSRDRYWFLPKGRKDAGEDLGRAAEREGFEESGYRNRLLPLPIQHRQPRPAHAPTQPTQSDGGSDVGSTTTAPSPPHLNSLLFSTEPVWTQLVPQSAHTQYILFWYVAETVPPDVEAALQQQQQHSITPSTSFPSTQTPPRPPPLSQAPYIPPPPYPPSLSLRDRLAAEPPDYVPPRHEGTGVDAEEALYESYLVPVDEAVGRLRGSVMADVVRKGWVGIKERREWEEKAE
ncbi:uncharacterized protein J3D65DRAFT_637774 [Phyllosticta citribraziliensis]|uniref:Nudix hydrolase domain-containing protein n=1 Tax=Phyllosticta citribraziliensis TaxID=989973 RepID=A0ABR1L8C6_9PEZI